MSSSPPSPELAGQLQRLAGGADVVGGTFFMVKGALLFLAWVGTGAALMSHRHGWWELVGLHVLWAVLGTSVALNVGHDAAHGVASRREGLNRLLSWSFALVGLSHDAWRLKHTELHHSFPNVAGRDPDVDLTPFLRAVPQHPRYRFHRWQHLYAPALYSMVAVALIVVLDFKVLALGRAPAASWLRAVAVKVGYLAAVLAGPVALGDNDALTNAVAYLAAAAVMGWLVAAVFLPAHLFLGVAEGAPDAPWVERQASTTLDIAPHSALVTHLVGGLNLNVVHHLVPGVAHTHLPRLRPEIEALLARAGLPYHHTSLGGAVALHLAHLRRLGSAGA